MKREKVNEKAENSAYTREGIVYEFLILHSEKWKIEMFEGAKFIGAGAATIALAGAEGGP